MMRNDVFDGQMLCPKRNWLLITQDGGARLQMQVRLETHPHLEQCHDSTDMTCAVRKGPSDYPHMLAYNCPISAAGNVC